MSGPARYLAGLKYAGVLLAVLGFAWFLPIDGGGDTTSGATLVERAGLFQYIGAPIGRDSDPADGDGNAHESGESTAAALANDSGTCTLRQSVLNTGREPLSRVFLEVAFLDSGGQMIGDSVSVEAAAGLAPGAERDISVRVACPEAAVRGTVFVPPKGSNGLAAQKIALVEQPATAEAGAAEVAVEVEPGFCSGPQPCEVMVAIAGGGAARFEFRRDPDAPDLMVSRDPILTSHLLGRGTAILNLGNDTDSSAIELTHLNVRRTEEPGLLSSWLGWIS